MPKLVAQVGVSAASTLVGFVLLKLRNSHFNSLVLWKRNIPKGRFNESYTQMIHLMLNCFLQLLTSVHFTHLHTVHWLQGLQMPGIGIINLLCISLLCHVLPYDCKGLPIYTQRVH